MASFPVKGGAIQANTFDPEEEALEALDFGITASQFFLAYYEPFVTAIDRSERIERTRRRTIAFVGETGIRVGLDNPILRRVQMATQGATEGLASEIRPEILDLTGPAQGSDGDAEIGQVFPDGTLIGTNWDDAIWVRDQIAG